MSKTADLPPRVKEVLEALRENFNILKIFLRDIRRTVKRDTATKIVSLATALSSFLPKPLNLALSGPSGVGKTKNALQPLKYFPQEDIWYLGGMSRARAER